MQSVLPLVQRLTGRVKRPKEIMRWSLDPDNSIHFDDRALRYYYFPQSVLDQEPPINLARGFDAEKFDPNANLAHYIDNLLSAIIHYEKETGAKLEADIVTWRGQLTQLIALSQGHADRNAINEPIELLVVGFDQQVFVTPQPKEQRTAADEWDVRSKRFTYTGYQFEQVSTLGKPWGECSRDEIDARYVTGFPSEHSEYGILVKSGIGSVDVVYGAETDCVENFKSETNKLANYVELKTTRVIENPGHARTFERKLMKTWIQSFLSGVPKIVYGFRDDELMLRAVEEYKTDDLPKFVKNSRVTNRNQQWSGKDAIDFYTILMQWIKDKVEDGKTYKLTFTPGTKELVLKEAEIKVEDREVAFLTNKFVQWRKAQNSR